MTKVPIVFSFDDNYTMPAGVCISSLLQNAYADTFYDIIIMHSSQRLSSQNKDQVLALKSIYSRCNIRFVDVKDVFNSAFETRNITIDTYFRLAIPEFVTEYDNVLYSDVDIIFTGDLSDLYLNGIGSFSLGAVKLDISQKHIAKYLKFIGLEPSNYYNAGFLVMNVSKIRKEDSLKQRAFPLIQHKLIFVDQDILNIAYKNDIIAIPHTYNYSFRFLLGGTKCKNPIVYHFMAKKPWKDACAFSDIWWDCYKKSIFYDEKFYLDYQVRVFRHCNDFKERNIIKRAISLIKMAYTTFGTRHVKNV